MRSMQNPSSPAYNISEDNRFAEMLKAVGHPVRLRIVRELVDKNSRCCGEMCNCFDLSQSTISQHLSVLKAAGIVSLDKVGTRSCYSVRAEALEFIEAETQKLLNAARVGRHD